MYISPSPTSPDPLPKWKVPFSRGSFCLLLLVSLWGGSSARAAGFEVSEPIIIEDASSVTYPSFLRFTSSEDRWLISLRRGAIVESAWRDAAPYGRYIGFLAPGDVEVSPQRMPQSFSRLAGDGKGFLAVRRETDYYTAAGDPVYSMYGMRISASGGVLDPAGFLIVPEMFRHDGPSVASNGTVYLIVWSENIASSLDQIHHNIKGIRVSKDGQVIDEKPFIIDRSDDDDEPAVASNGDGFLVTWRSLEPETGSRAISGARISAEGHVLDPDGFLISDAPGFERHPAAASNGGDYLVVWSDSRDFDVNERDIYGTIVTTDGRVQPPSGFAVSTALARQDFPRVAPSRDGFLVTWSSWKHATGIYGDDSRLFASLVEADGSVDAVGGQPLTPANRGVNVFGGTGSSIDGQHIVVYIDAGVTPWSGDRDESDYSLRAVFLQPANTETTLTTPAFEEGIGFQILASSSFGAGLRIESSPDLNEWIELETLTNHTGRALVTDSQVDLATQKFYRAVEVSP